MKGKAAAAREAARERARPLVIVLEHYVLAAIGEMPPERAGGIGEVVRQAFGGGDDWMATVRGHLQLDATVDQMLREMWLENQAAAREHAAVWAPAQFAKIVVERNFGELIAAIEE